MLTNEQREAVVAGTKIGTAWGSVGVATWAEAATIFQAVASLFAAVLTFLYITDFVWKKWLRPFCEWRGWMPARRRRKADDDKTRPGGLSH